MGHLSLWNFWGWHKRFLGQCFCHFIFPFTSCIVWIELFLFNFFIRMAQAYAKNDELRAFLLNGRGGNSDNGSSGRDKSDNAMNSVVPYSGSSRATCKTPTCSTPHKLVSCPLLCAKLRVRTGLSLCFFFFCALPAFLFCFFLICRSQLGPMYRFLF